VAPLIEDMNLELDEAPAECDVLLGSQLLVSKQQHGMLLVSVINDYEAFFLNGPGDIEAAYLGAQRRVERMY